MKSKRIHNRVLAFLLSLALLGGDFLPALAGEGIDGSQQPEDVLSAPAGEEEPASPDAAEEEDGAARLYTGYVEPSDERVAALLDESISMKDIWSATPGLTEDDWEPYGVVLSEKSKEAAFPYAYSKTDTIKTYFSSNYPAARSQDPYDSCWTFAASGLAEFDLLTRSVAGVAKDIDLSELHLAYFAYHDGSTPIAGDTGDRVSYVSGGSRKNFLDAGGNLLFAAQTLLQNRGFVKESDVPYTNATSVAAGGLSAEKERGLNYRCLKDAYEINIGNSEKIKEEIVKRGMVGAAIHADPGFYSEANNSYYTGDYVGTDHAVGLVGWDDNFPKDKFKAAGGVSPSSDGAWLVRNSWNSAGSADLGFNTYFWISYEDGSLTKSSGSVPRTVWAFNMYDAEGTPGNYYSYDAQIHSTTYFTSNTSYSANIFKAAGSGSDEYITAVRFGAEGVGSTGTGYEIRIYTEIPDGGGVTSGKLQSQATTNGKIFYNGYYTVPLQKPVAVKKGDNFSVIVKRDDGKSVEIEANATKDSGNGVSYTVGSASGQSYYSANGTNWSDLSGQGPTIGNFVIGALTSNCAAPPTASLPSGSKWKFGEKITLSCETSGAKIYYTLDGSDPASSDTAKLYDSSTGVVLGADFEDDNVTLRACAKADGYDDSPVVSFSYVVVRGARVEAYLGGTQIANGEQKIITKDETFSAVVYNDSSNQVTDATLTWKSSEPEVASVSEGKVLVNKSGKTTITVSSVVGGKTVSTSFILTVQLQVADVAGKLTSDPASPSEVQAGTTVSLICSLPESKIYYRTGDSESAAQAGEFKLYANPITVPSDKAELYVCAYFKARGYDESAKKIFKFVITSNEPRLIVSPTEFRLDKNNTERQLEYKFYKADGTVDGSAAFTFASDRESVAVVDSTGLVKAKGSGTAVITVSSNGLQAISTVEVNLNALAPPAANPVDGRSLSPTSTITLTTSEAGASIYYSFSETAEKSKFSLYSGPLSLPADAVSAGKAVLRAYVKHAPYDDSDIAVFRYTITDAKTITLVPANGGTVIPNPVKMEHVGYKYQVKAIVTDGEGNVNDTAAVSWNSSNAAVAEVAPDGLKATITAKGEGNAVVTATCGSVSANINVLVSAGSTPTKKLGAPKNLSSSTGLKVGTKILLSSAESGADIYYDLTGTAEADAFLLYDGGVDVTKEMAGNTVILRAFARKEGFLDSDIVSFSFKVLDLSRLSLAKGSMVLTSETEPGILKVATLLGPDGKADDEAVVSWSSSDTGVAVVNGDAASASITAVANGSAVITAEYGTKTASCKVTVMLGAEISKPASIAITPESIELAGAGDKATISVTVKDKDGVRITDPEISFVSKAPEIADVLVKGVVTAVSGGETQIIVSAGELEATCSVKVLAETACEVPVADPMSGSTVLPGDKIRLTSPQGAKIFYTFSESASSSDYSLYAGPISVPSDYAEKVFRFTAYCSGEGMKDSARLSFVYLVEDGSCVHKWSAPVWDWTGTTSENGVAKATFACSVCKEKITIDAVVRREVVEGGVRYGATVHGPDGEIYTDSVFLDSSGKKTDAAVVIEGIKESYEYTGIAIRPDFVVHDYERDVILANGTDYSVSYKNNKNEGIASVFVSGKGNYQGLSLSKTFRIVKAAADEAAKIAALKGAKVASIKPQSFTGEEIFPDITLTLAGGSAVLYSWDGDGYVEPKSGEPIPAIVSVANNVKKGNASILLAGSDGKQIKKSFKITAVDIGKSKEISVLTGNASYQVKGSRPESVEISYAPEDGEELTLVEGQDYTLSFKQNKGTGSGKMVIKGKGNFKGSRTESFEISEFYMDEVLGVTAYAGIKADKVKVVITDDAGNTIPASLLNVEVTGSDGDILGKTVLKAGDLITVNVKPSKKGSGLVSGEPSVSLKVGTNIGKASVSATSGFSVKYTGGPVTLSAEDFDKNIKVSYAGQKLVCDRDFEVIAYSNNVKKGSMTVTIRGIGDKYSGTKSFKVRIRGKFEAK
ncbi:MAG: chitobiase/beta-hexosaminidase C-terminal domain-containing protein [Lachnospiraceae bacterium]|nr:chitobiase/beta-hexosaminidase C-terminal domain-containing protein [Lachnospiraceae bacterium]